MSMTKREVLQLIGENSFPETTSKDIYAAKDALIPIKQNGIVKAVPVDLLNQSDYNPKPFSPKQLTNLVAWYDASDLSSLTIPSPYTKVSQINDKSGNNYHLTQTDSAQYPLLNKTGGNGSTPCVEFTGAERMKYNDTTVPLSQPMTCFIVMKHGAWLASGSTILDFTNAHNTGLYYIESGDGKRSMVNAAGAYAHEKWRNSYTNVQNEWIVVTFLLNGTSSFMWINGEPSPHPTELGLVTNAGSNNGTQIWIGGWGGGERAAFLFKEMILCNTAVLTEEQRMEVVNYLLSKHKIVRNPIYKGYGDSLTKGAGATDFYVNSFAALFSIETGRQMYNYGLSGSTVYSLSTQYKYGIEDKNALITLCYGTNEGSVDATWKAYYKMMVQQLIFEGHSPEQICLVTPPYYSTRVTKNNQILTYLNEIAAEIPGVLVANTIAPTQAGGGDSLLPDGTHPNNAGHRIIADTIKAAFGF